MDMKLVLSKLPKSVLSKLTNDMHIPIALLVFATTTAYHFHTGNDLGAGYVSSLYAFYAFLGGHAAIYQFKPDQDQDQNASTGAQS